MATDFMPRMPDQQQQQQAAYYHQTHQQMQMGAAAAAAAGVGNMYYGSGGGGIQQYPQISPHSTSPTSPSTKSYHSRQLRPLYTPAVLRPTEFPSKLPTRRQCQPAGGQAEGDGAGAGGNDQSGSSAAASIKSSGSFISLSGLSALSSRLTRRASAGCSKINKNDWNLDMFPQVTDAPKRTHWKVGCDIPVLAGRTCATLMLQ